MTSTRVAVPTDDGTTISEHFGRAESYIVYSIENGMVTGKETRPKASHQHPSGSHPEASHASGEGALHQNMLSNVADCEAILARGMGWGMYQAMKGAGIRPFMTDIASADEAVKAYASGTLVDHPERLH